MIGTKIKQINKMAAILDYLTNRRKHIKWLYRWRCYFSQENFFIYVIESIENEGFYQLDISLLFFSGNWNIDGDDSLFHSIILIYSFENTDYLKHMCWYLSIVYPTDFIEKQTSW